MSQVMEKQDLLSAEEELRLITMAQGEGNKKRYGLDRLVRHNQGLVHRIVQRFPLKNAVVTYEDLYQQGMCGFLHAVELFDTTRGIRLSTYAYRWIHAFIQRYWQNTARTVRVPAHLSDKFYANKKVIDELTLALGRTPTLQEIPEGVRKVAEHFSPIISLNITLNDNGEEIGDIQTDESSVSTVMEVESYLYQLSGLISPRDYNILLQRYGLNGEAEHTLSEIAEKYDISRARIHQIIGKNLSLLQQIVTNS